MVNKSTVHSQHLVHTDCTGSFFHAHLLAALLLPPNGPPSGLTLSGLIKSLERTGRMEYKKKKHKPSFLPTPNLSPCILAQDVQIEPQPPVTYSLSCLTIDNRRGPEWAREAGRLCFSAASRAELKAKGGSSVGQSCERAAEGSCAREAAWEGNSATAVSPITAFHRHEERRTYAESRWCASADKDALTCAFRRAGQGGAIKECEAEMLKESRAGKAESYRLYTAAVYGTRELLTRLLIS